MPKRHPADIAGLSTLEVPDPIIRLPQVHGQQTLAPVVVFAAAIQPGHPPDVAIGLALAAHLARANQEKVSLVVVPHYLESDPELEHKLQSQHELVTGGVTLGQTPTVPEDTRALLRQLLTARDRQGVLGQLQDNLGSVGPLIAALLALGGLAAATRITALIVLPPLERKEQDKGPKQIEDPPLTDKYIFDRTREKTEMAFGRVREIMMPKVSDWRSGLAENQEVTVWLRSGRQVTGIIKSQIPPNTRDATVFRIKIPLPEPKDAESSREASPPGPKGKTVLVSVRDIEQIDINEAAQPNQPRRTVRRSELVARDGINLPGSGEHHSLSPVLPILLIGANPSRGRSRTRVAVGHHV